MAFCQRKILRCLLRSTESLSNSQSALRSLLVQRTAQETCSVRSNSSNSVSESTLAALSAVPPQLFTATTSQSSCSPYTTGPDFQHGRPLGYSMSPSTNITEYKCPATTLLEQLSQIAILDKTPTQNLSYECPVAVPVIENFAPDLEKSEILEPGSKPVAKEAKMIMRIRHKKMKKHKLKKLRKRMYFLWKRQKQTRKAKRMTIYNKEIEGIKATGEEFNAEEFVRSQLAKARRGGYYINVFETKHR